MADILILAIAIASAVSLLIVSPCEAQRKALRTLRAYGETEALTHRRSWRRPRKTCTNMFTPDKSDVR
jgi:hypothetical protein